MQVEDARHRKLARAAGAGRAGASRGETIRAPIAGKVVKVLVEIGATVAPGSAVIVLEAMKMENEPRQPSAAAPCRVGAQAGGAGGSIPAMSSSS